MGSGDGTLTRSCDAGGTWLDEVVLAANDTCGMPFFSHGPQEEDCIGFDGEENRREMSARNLTAGAGDTSGHAGILGVSRCFWVGYGRIAIQMRRASNKLLELSSPLFPRNSIGTCLLGKARELESGPKELS